MGGGGGYLVYYCISFGVRVPEEGRDRSFCVDEGMRKCTNQKQAPLLWLIIKYPIYYMALIAHSSGNSHCEDGIGYMREVMRGGSNKKKRAQRGNLPGKNVWVNMGYGNLVRNLY